MLAIGRVAEVLSASGPVAATRTGRDKRRHRQILTAAWAENLATVHHLRNSVWCGGALRSDDTHPRPGQHVAHDVGQATLVPLVPLGG